MTRKPGRPPRAERAATERVEVRVTKDERKAWEQAAGDLALAEWIRQRCNDDPRPIPKPVVRITVERDGDDEWYWCGYDKDGRKVDGGGIEVVERRAVIEHVEGMGTRVDEDAIVEMI